MKRESRSVVVLLLTIVLSIQIAPIAQASVRNPDDFATKIERVIQRLQRFFRLIPFDSSVIPPVP
jgi:hypothetical protein